MNNEHKILAYRAIDENVDHTTARKIIRYVMECELWGQDTVSPTNQYLMNKFGWSLETVKVAISKAKKSQFIATTGYGKKRCLELNVSFLKGKMGESYQKTIRARTDFNDVIPEASANTLANTSANTLANSLANSSEEKNGSTEPKKVDFCPDNNNNYNNNIGETKVSRSFEVVRDADNDSWGSPTNGGKRKSKHGTKTDQLLKRIEQIRGSKFSNPLKQKKYIKMMLEAGIPAKAIGIRWSEVRQSEWWRKQDLEPDMKNISDSFDKKPYEN